MAETHLASDVRSEATNTNAETSASDFAGPITPAESDWLRSLNAVEDAAADQHLAPLDLDELQITPGAPPPEPSAWTIVIDLATNLPTPDGEIFGAQQKLETLLELAAQTAGSDITFVVQATDEVKKPHELKAGDYPNLERYVIRDGQVYQTYDGPSGTTVENLTGLLAEATTVAPTDNLGLIIQSHGLGTDGIMGDAGPVSLDELNTVITQALAAGGQDKLALLDFDSCLMGTAGVIEAVRDLAGHVLASPEVEEGCASESNNLIDGQNVAEALRRALADEDLQPEELAQYFSDVANEGLNGISSDGTCAATWTLSQYDTAEMGNFTAALNELGLSLSVAAGNEGNLEQIAADIEGITVINGDASPLITNRQRDLGQFLDALSESIADGEIADPQGNLLADIATMQQALDDLIVDYHGEGDKYSDLTGLTLYLPEDNWVDPIYIATDMYTDMIDGLASFENEVETDTDNLSGIRAHVTPMIDSLSRTLANSLPAEYATDAATLQASLDGFANTSDDQLVERIKEIREAAREFFASAGGQSLIALAAQRYPNRLEQIADVQIPDAYSGWATFIDTLTAAKAI